MDNAADPYDLITVLSRLEGIGREFGQGHSVGDDDLGVTATAGRTGLFRRMLRLLRSRRFGADGSAPHKELGCDAAAYHHQHSRLSFDTNHRPTCPHCGARAYLTRRTPHPDHDLRYELQIFTCSACDHTIERIVDANGNPPADNKVLRLGGHWPSMLPKAIAQFPFSRGNKSE
jgi:hypothetical protein